VFLTDARERDELHRVDAVRDPSIVVIAAVPPERVDIREEIRSAVQLADRVAVERRDAGEDAPPVLHPARPEGERHRALRRERDRRDGLPPHAEVGDDERRQPVRGRPGDPDVTDRRRRARGGGGEEPGEHREARESERERQHAVPGKAEESAHQDERWYARTWRVATLGAMPRPVRRPTHTSAP
jgi:hypothetical protein